MFLGLPDLDPDPSYSVGLAYTAPIDDFVSGPLAIFIDYTY